MQTENDAPSSKRFAPERLKSAAAASHNVENAAPLGSARARFLQELEQYASDEEEGPIVLVNRNTVEGNAFVHEEHRRPSNIPTGPSRGRGAVLTAHAGPPSRGGPPSIAADADETFFFEDPTVSSRDQNINDDNGAGDGGRGRQGPYARSVGPASNTPTFSLNAPGKVGLQLLHRMHAEGTAERPVDPEAPSTISSVTTSGSFEVVHTYVPLSTGGFLSTTTSSDDAMEGRQVRVGDVLCLRKPLGSSTAPPQTSVITKTPTSSPTAPAPPLTPAGPGAPGNTSEAGAVERVALNAMRHFKSAAVFTSEEQKYGRQLTPDMVRLLFEVARVDPHRRSIEAVFLDGTRAKVSFLDVRPAGYVERAVYATWKADPSSRPLITIHSNASSPTTATAAMSPSTASPGSPAPFPSASPTSVAATWWVLPRLLVRLTAESAGDWYGKKCVVKAVYRRENRIRLTEWREEREAQEKGDAKKQQEGSFGFERAAAPSGALEERELVGLDGIETVVPRKGGRAMVVLGNRRGEMCTVLGRVRGADGSLTVVEVEMHGTKEVLTMNADEICALAR